MLKAVHLRHDAPRAWPGWELDYLQVFVTPLPGPSAPAAPSRQQGSPGRFAQPATQRGAPTTLTSILGPPGSTGRLGQQAPGLGRPQLPYLYILSAPLDAAQAAWPSAELAYVRHWLTREAAAFGENPAL